MRAIEPSTLTNDIVSFRQYVWHNFEEAREEIGRRNARREEVGGGAQLRNLEDEAERVKNTCTAPRPVGSG